MFGNWRPYVEKRPRIDEHAEDYGLLIGPWGWCLIGVETGIKTSMFSLILLNQAAGIWRDVEANEYGFWSGVGLLPLLRYLIRIVIVVGLMAWGLG